MTTYIIGHQKPDTDSVVGAMALEFLYKQQACFNINNPQAVIVNELNPETKYIFNKLKVATPKVITASELEENDLVVLVDHNEEKQRLTNLPQEKIIEIVDHHKLNINFNRPIFATVKPWGSSCTIIYHQMKQNKVKPDKQLATLMLSAILSDTVGYKSATTTKKDIEVGQELVQLAQVEDVETFTLEIFKAKSDISSLSNEQIVKNDYKLFDFNGTSVMIDQLETVEQELVLKTKKAELLEAMKQVKKELNTELLFVVITDILQVNSKLLILTDQEAEVATKAFGGKIEDNVLDIGAKLSRKKQIAPAIEQALTK